MAADIQSVEGIEVTTEEADDLGLFEEDALSAEDAREATEQEG